MKQLSQQIKEKLLDTSKEPHEKDSFWATESELNKLEIFHRWKGTPPTNPFTPEKQLEYNMRTLVEKAFIDMVRELGIIVEPPEGEQHRVEMEREGVKVSGYMDAIIKEDGNQVPVEFKTSFGRYAQEELQRGEVKSSYVKQLAVYMDFMGVDKGYIVQAHFMDTFIIDDIYQFTVTKEGSKVRCGMLEFDLVEDVYKRWRRIYDENISKDIEPESEYRYKYPLEEIDWKTIPRSKITNARAGRAVIGDWQVIYSGYKDLIIEKEGSALGYSEKEIEEIKQKTSGYTTWK